MTREELAKAYFLEGYNCAQAVVLSFQDLLEESPERLAQLSSGFGGGMGRLRETCGAVSGMTFVLNALYGYGTPETGDVKKEHYARIQETALEFEKRHGSLICRELLGLKSRHDEPSPSPRTADFYDTRPCPGLIGDAARILDEFITFCGRENPSL